jgi:hypothetical protein
LERIDLFTHENEDFEFGEIIEISDNSVKTIVTKWMCLKKNPWFTLPPMKILKIIGVKCTDNRRASDFASP